MRAARSVSCVTTTRLVPSAALSSSSSSNTRTTGRPVEIAGRLVGEHGGRPRDERARDGRALSLAARELPRTMLEPLAQADALEQPARFGRGLLRRRAAHEQRHRNVLERRELGQQMVKLIDEAERAIA